MSLRSSRANWALAAGVAAILCCAGASGATTRTWTGAVSTDWSNNGNWDTVSPGGGDIALFNSVFANQPGLTANSAVDQIQVGASVGQDFTISGGFTLTINASSNPGIDMTATAKNLSITCAVALNGVQTWDVTTGRLLTISGAVSNGANALTVQGAGDTTISGVLGAGAGTLTKNGTGTLTLSNAANTYAGQTTINAGTVSVVTLASGSAASSLGAPNPAGNQPILIGSATAATLKYTGAGDSTSRQITTSGAGGVTIQNSGTGLLTLSGNIDNSGNLLTFDTNAANITASGAISGTGALTKISGNTLTLSNAGSSYTGQTTINQGIVSVTKLDIGANISSLGQSATAILLGSASAATLSYTGAGDSTDRQVTVNGAGGGTIQNSGTGLLTFAGNIDIGANPKVLTFDTSAANITVSSVISGAGGGALTKISGNTLRLSNANTFTGGVTLNLGTLQAANSNALGTTAGTFTLNGGKLDLATDTSINAYNTVVAGNATIAPDKATAASAGITHILGTLSIGANTLSIDEGGNVNSGTAGLTFGATTLGGAPTFIINNSGGGGTALLTVGAVNNGANTATLDGSGNFAQTGVWGAGSGGITLAGSFSGTATLNQANTFTGTVTLNAGTLVATADAGALGTGAANLALAGGTLRLANDSALSFGRNTTVSTDSVIIVDRVTSGAGVTHTLGTLGIGANTLSTNGGANVTSGTAGLTFGATTLSGASTFTINNPVGGGGTTLTVAAVTNGANTPTLKGNGSFAQTGVWGSGAGGITLDATYSGTATLNQANTFTGIVTLNAGTLVATADAGALGTGAASLTLAGGTLRLANNSALNFGRNTTVSADSVIIVDRVAAGAGVTHTLGTLGIGANALSISGGNVTSGTAGLTFGATTLSGASIFTINKPAGGGTTLFTVDAVANGANTATLKGDGNLAQTGVWGSGAGGITLDTTYSGTATLSQANTFTGPVTIDTTSGGIVTLGNATGLGPAANAVVTFGNNSTGTLNLNQNNVTVVGLNTGSPVGAPVVQSNSGAGGTDTLTVNNAVDCTYAGVLRNGSTRLLALTKQGTAALTLSGNNTYSGLTTLSAGTLNIDSTTAIGSGTFTISAAATINNTSGGAITLSNNNVQNWDADFTFTGTNDLNLGTGNVTLGANRQVTVNGGTLTVGGNVNDGGSTFDLTKAGAGTLTLTAANGYDGATTVNAGVLLVNGSITDSSGVTVNSGGTLGGSGTVSAISTGAGTGKISPANTTTSMGTLTCNDNVTFNTNSTYEVQLDGSGTPGATGTNADHLNGFKDTGGSRTYTLGGNMNVTSYNNPAASVTYTIISLSGSKLSRAGTFATCNGQTPNPLNGGTFTVGVRTLQINYSTQSVTLVDTTNPPKVWVGGPTNDNWTTADNWVGGVAPVTGDALEFPAGGGQTRLTTNTNDFNPNTFTFRSITFTGPGGGYTLSGNSVQLSGGATALNNNVGAANTVNLPIAFITNDPTISCAATGTLTVGGTINIDDAGNGVTLTVNSSGATILNGVISGAGAVANPSALTISGSGTVTLAGANTFGQAGTNVTLSAGTLNINNATALGNAANTFVISGPAVIDNTTGGTIHLTNNNPQQWNSDFTFTGTQNLNLENGAVLLGATRQVTVTNINSLLMVYGPISDGGNAYGLTKAGSGVLVLGGTNGYTGATIVNAGKLQVDGHTSSSAVTVNSSGTLAGGGTVGSVTVAAGQTGTVSPGPSTTVLNTGALSLSSAATFVVNLNGTTANSYDALIVTGTANLNSDAGLGSNLTLTLTNATPAAGDTYTIISSSGVLAGFFNGLPFGATVVVNGRALSITYTPNAVILTDVTGVFAWRGLGLDDNWSTGLNWAGGVPPTGAGENLLFGMPLAQRKATNINNIGGSFAKITINDTGYALNWNGVVATAITAGINVSSVAPAPGNNTIAFPLTFNTTQTVTTDNAVGSLTISGAIGGAGGVTKAGVGTLALNNAGNGYGGATLINAGTLSVSGGNAIPDASAVTVGVSATLSLAANETIGDLDSGGAGGFVALNTFVLTVNEATSSMFKGTITSTGAGNGLIKAGAGLLDLDGANTYTGGTALNAGTLSFSISSSGSSGPVGMGTLTIANGTTILAFAGPRDLANAVTANGDFTVSGSQPLTLSGPMDLGAGAPRTITVSNSALTKFSGVLSNGALTKAGTGTLTLSGASTYGATAIQDGTVIVTGGNDRLPTATTVTLGNGAANGILQLGDAGGASNQTLAGLLTSGTGTTNAVLGGNAAVSTLTLNIGADETFDGILGGGGANQNNLALTKTGGSTLVLTNANNTFSEPTAINGGILQVDGTDANSAVTVSSGCSLAGSGTVGSVTVAGGQTGTVSPGPSAAATAVLNTGAVLLGSAATFVVNLNGTAAGSYDALNVTGTINLNSDAASGSTLTLTLNNGAPAVGDVYTIISSSGARSGFFNGFPDQTRIVTAPVVRTLLIDYQTNLVRLVDITGSAFAWSGAGADNNWTTKENWFLDLNSNGVLDGGEIASVGPTAGENDNLIFGNGPSSRKGTGNNDFPAGTGFDSLTFMDTGYTIGGARIALGAGGITATAAAGTNELDTPLTFAASQTITANAGTLTLGGVINETAASGLTKAGAGALTLSGANTFTGGVALNAGTLNINNASALGTTAGAFTINGGTIDNTSGGAITTSNYVQTWGADFVFSGSNALNLGTGAVTMSANRLVTVNGSTLTVGGAIGGGAVTLTKAGVGTLQFSGGAANTYSGLTTVNDGALQLNKTAPNGAVIGNLTIGDGVGPANSAVVQLLASDQVATGTAVSINTDGQFDLNNFNQTIGDLSGVAGSTVALGAGAGGTLTTGDATDTTFAGVISGTGSLVKQGADTFTLTGANTYSGGTTLNAGTLAAGSNSAVGTGTLTINGGTTILASGGAITMSNTVAVGGDFTVGGSDPLALSGAMALGGSTRTVTFSNTALTTFSGAISGAAGTGLTKAGTGALQFDGGGANTYSGATTVNDGTLNLNKTAANGAIAGSLTIGDGAGAANSAVVVLLASNQIADTSAVSLKADGQLNLNNLNETAGSLAGDAGSSLVCGDGAANTFTVGDANNTVFAGVISGADATDNFVKAGSGTLELAGPAANTFAGVTSVNDGVLALNKSVSNGTIVGNLTIGDGVGGADSAVVRLSASDQIADASPLTINTDGQLDLNGFNEKINTLAMTSGDVATGAGTLTLGGDVTGNANAAVAAISGNLDLGAGAPRTFTIASGGGAVDMNITALIGNGALTKAGPGTLKLGGANTYAGDTTISAGTLALGADNVLPDGAGNGNVAVTGTLDLAGHSDTINGLSGTGTVDNSVTGGPFALAVGNNDAAGTFGGVIKNSAGTLALTKTGAGNVTLTGNNTYSGLTTVNSGALIVQGQQSGSNAVVNANAMLAVGQSGTTGDVTVNANGRLSGNGKVGAITAAGIVAPGIPGLVGPGGSGLIGTLTCASADFSGGGTLLIRIPSSTSADKLEVTGTLTTGGTSALVADLAGYQSSDKSSDPAAAHYGALTGQFVTNPNSATTPHTGIIPNSNTSGKGVKTDYSFAPNPNAVTIHVDTPPTIVSGSFAGRPNPVGFDFLDNFSLQVQTDDSTKRLKYYWDFSDPSSFTGQNTQQVPADDFHSAAYTPQLITQDQSSLGDGANATHSYSSASASLYHFLPNGTRPLTITVTVDDGHGGFAQAQFTLTLVNPLGNGSNVGEDYNVTNPGNGLAIASKGNGNIIKFDVLQVAEVDKSVFVEDILQLPPKYPTFQPAKRLTASTIPTQPPHVSLVLTGIGGADGRPLSVDSQVPVVTTDTSTVFVNCPSAGIYLLTIADGVPDDPSLRNADPRQLDQAALSAQLKRWSDGGQILARKMINIDTAELTKGNRANAVVSAKDSFITGKFLFSPTKSDYVTFKGTFPLPNATESSGNIFNQGVPVKLSIGIGNVIAVATLRNLKRAGNGVWSGPPVGFDAVYNAQGVPEKVGRSSVLRFKYYENKFTFTIDPQKGAIVAVKGQAILQLQIGFPNMSAGGFDTEGIVRNSAAAKTGSARRVYDPYLRFYDVGSTTLAPVFPTQKDDPTTGLPVGPAIVAEGITVGVGKPLINLFEVQDAATQIRYRTNAATAGFKTFKGLPLQGTLEEFEALDLRTGETIPVVDPDTGKPTGANLVRPQTIGFDQALAPNDLEPVAIQFNLLVGNANVPALASYASLIRAGYIVKGQTGRIVGHSTSRTSR